MIGSNTNTRKHTAVAVLFCLAVALVACFAWWKQARSGQRVSLSFGNGRPMCDEVRAGEWYPFGIGSVGEVPLLRGVYRNAAGDVVSRVVKGTGTRVMYYPDGAIQSISVYSRGRVCGPSLNFSRSGVLTAYGSFDDKQIPHGPFAGYHSNGQLRYLNWYVHGSLSGEVGGSVPK